MRADHNSGSSTTALEPGQGSASLWTQRPVALNLPRDEVHVWRASLDLAADRIASLSQYLNSDELSRAARYRFQKDRDRFVVARGVLRSLLGLYLRLEPSLLRFQYGPYGKPAVFTVAGQTSINFNVSHAGGLALYAFAWDREVGIDIERVQPIVGIMELAQPVFSPGEIATLGSLPTDLQGRAFYTCWTRKEAYIKARGEGLFLPLDQFDVSLLPGTSVRLLKNQALPDDVYRWSLCALELEDDHAATLAVEGHGWCLRCWQWPDEVYQKGNGGDEFVPGGRGRQDHLQGSCE